MAMGWGMGSGASAVSARTTRCTDSLLLLRVNSDSVLSSTWRLRELEAPKGSCFPRGGASFPGRRAGPGHEDPRLVLFLTC